MTAVVDPRALQPVEMANTVGVPRPLSVPAVTAAVVVQYIVGVLVSPKHQRLVQGHPGLLQKQGVLYLQGKHKQGVLYLQG